MRSSPRTSTEPGWKTLREGGDGGILARARGQNLQHEPPRLEAEARGQIRERSPEGRGEGGVGAVVEGNGTRLPLDAQGRALEATLDGPRKHFETLGEGGVGGGQGGGGERRLVAVAGHEFDARHGCEGAGRGQIAAGYDGDVRDSGESLEGGEGGGRDARVLGVGNDGGEGAVEVAGDEQGRGAVRELAEAPREGRVQRHAPSRAPRKVRPQAWASRSRTAATSRSLMRPGRPSRAARRALAAASGSSGLKGTRPSSSKPA